MSSSDFMARKLRESKLAVPAPKTFNDVPIKDWDLLRTRVAAAKGRVIVLVHPFFQKTIIKERIKKLVRQSKTPVVVLEGYSRVENTRRRLDRIAYNSHLILPTGINAPHLLVSGSTPSHTQLFDVEQELLARKLSECGAKTVLVAGLQSVAFHQRYLRERANKKLDRFLAGYFHKTRLPKTRSLLLKAAARDPVLMKFLVEEVPAFASYRKLKGVARRERKWRGEPAKLLTSFATGGCAGVTYANLLLSPHLQDAVVRLVPGVVMPNKPPYLHNLRVRQALAKNRGLISKIRGKPNH